MQPVRWRSVIYNVVRRLSVTGRLRLRLSRILHSQTPRIVTDRARHTLMAPLSRISSRTILPADGIEHSYPGPSFALLIDDIRFSASGIEITDRTRSLHGFLTRQDLHVTFVSAAPHPGKLYPRRVGIFGHSQPQGQQELIRHLQVYGDRYKIALVGRPELTEHYQAIVHAQAPHVAIIVQVDDCSCLHSKDPSGVFGHGICMAERDNRLLCSALRAADRVTVKSVPDREALRAHFAELDIAVLPAPGRQDSYRKC